MSSSVEAFLSLHSWGKLRFSQMDLIVDEQSSSPPYKIPPKWDLFPLMPLWGRYLARSPLIQPTGCKLDHFSMLCWNLLPLGRSPSVVNILIPLGSFCKKCFVSQSSHWSTFTILSSMVFGETLAEMSRRHPDGPVSSCRLKHCPLTPTVRALLMFSWLVDFLVNVKLWTIWIPPWFREIVWTVLGWAPKEDLLGQHWLIPKHTQVSIVPVYWNNPVVCQTAVKLMLTIFLGTPTKNTNWADGSEKSDSCASNMKETKGKSKWK